MWQSFLVRIIGKVTEKRVSLDYLSSKTMHSYNWGHSYFFNWILTDYR